MDSRSTTDALASAPLPTRRGWLDVVLLFSPAVLAFLLVLIGTRNGVGISADSAIYISVARELAAGHGPVIPWGAMQPVPLGDNLGVLYPAILAAGIRLGIDPLSATRWLNAALFGAAVLLVAMILWQGTKSIRLASLVAALLASSRELLGIYCMAWSEPPFLLLSVAVLYLLAVHGCRGRPWILLGACLMTVLASLTRWAGTWLVVAGFATLMLGRFRLRNRVLAAACVAALLGLPVFAGGPTWYAYIYQSFRLGPELTDPGSPERVYLVANLYRGAAVLVDWVWPWILSGVRWGWGGHVVLSACLAVFLTLLALHARFSGSIKNRDQTEALRANLCWIAGLFVSSYSLFLIVVTVFFGKNQIQFDNRILSPLLMPGLMLGAFGAYSLWAKAGGRRSVAGVALILCLAMLLTRVPRAVDRSIEWAGTSGSGAEGFHDARWQASATIAVVRQLQEGLTLFSNAPDAVYLLAGRNSCRLPTRHTLAAASHNPDGGEVSLDDLRQALARGALLVYFDRLAWRGAMPSLQELEPYVHLRTVLRCADGTICAGASLEADRPRSQDHQRRQSIAGTATEMVRNRPRKCS